MLGAARIVDGVARTQVVEAVRPGRMFAARQQQCVDQAVAGDQRLAAALELGIEKGKVERRIVDDQRRVADERQEFLGDLGETRLVLERSEEHTSELQSLRHLVCRLLLEKKKQNKNKIR